MPTRKPPASAGLPPIPVGERIMVGRCPNCLEAVEARIELGVRYQVDDAGISTIKPVMHTKPVPHRCGQISALDPDTDEVGTRPLDFAERAAGDRSD